MHSPKVKAHTVFVLGAIVVFILSFVYKDGNWNHVNSSYNPLKDFINLVLLYYYGK